MAKKIYYEAEAREKVLSGAKQLYDAVKVTFGPKGKNVIIEKEYGAPVITHDGVTVAEAVELKNDETNLGEAVGAKLIKSAAQKLNKVAGDGTTTVTVLTYEILNEANKLIAAGVNPMELRKGIERAGAEIIKGIDGLTEKIEGNSKKVAEVATISTGDAEIGELIANVIEKIGKDGVVTVEAGKSPKAFLTTKVIPLRSSSPTLIAKKPSLTSLSSLSPIKRFPPPPTSYRSSNNALRQGRKTSSLSPKKSKAKLSRCSYLTNSKASSILSSSKLRPLATAAKKLWKTSPF